MCCNDGGALVAVNVGIRYLWQYLSPCLSLAHTIAPPCESRSTVVDDLLRVTQQPTTETT